MTNNVIRDYYTLTKPGIIRGNMIAAAAGFMLASQSHFDAVLFCIMLSGIACIVAAGCVFNNYFDRDIDALMQRTQERALVTGKIPLFHALVFGTMVLLGGVALLGFGANLLTLLVATFGLFMYVVVYSMWTKRHTLHATLVGAISGAVPPVVGYVAVTDTLDAAAALLFLILAAWQIPHALAITMYRKEDYTAASVPLVSESFGIHRTKLFMALYVAIYTMATVALAILDYVSPWIGALFTLSGILWFRYTISGFWTGDDRKWGKKMFVYSLISLLVFCVLIAVDAIWKLLS